MILTAREPGGQVEPSELAAYLALHGTEACTWACTPDPGALGDALLGEAGKTEADLLVMGAYGHSRFREMVLGGVTRGILKRHRNSGVPDALIPDHPRRGRPGFATETLALAPLLGHVLF